ncbi:DUF3617 family protein [Altererythrobacter sp. MF3-039]|uniref:DUF3617 family protein n=1 Tax=Altererythrobacter sp. MF3-039 TaxID=3252901 RepID=UPI00390C4E1E
MASLAVVPAGAQAPGADLLGSLKKGEWEVRHRDGTANERICVRTGRELIQLRHQGQTCRRSSVESEQDEMAVQYVCRGKGYGRTSVRKETATLVQLESHGVANDLPFHFTAEARYIGTCG